MTPILEKRMLDRGGKSRSLPILLVAGVALVGIIVGVRMLLMWTPSVPPVALAPFAAPDAPAVASPAPTELRDPPANTEVALGRPDTERLPVSQQESMPQGIHAFPPLGTRQLLSGIIVPDDFELPSGYVRHRQTTDTGELLPPILMFHPHDPALDWRGEPIPVTSDRIVPPELAPNGMPITILEVPQSGPPPSGISRLLERN